MTRAFRAIQSGLVILTLVLLGSVAQAGPKKKIAILGIEAVVGANGQIDPVDTQFAKDLTRELRNRANNSADFDLTKDQRELVDEKLMNNCGSEDPKCMAKIGDQMKAEVLLFGKVENMKNGYKVTLKLVDVGNKKQIASDPNATIAQAETKNPGLANWVREHWRKLTGESSTGELVIRIANAQGGRVLIDGQTRDTLKSGTATIALPEGRYKVGVEADGFKLWEKEGVTISADKPVELSPPLEKAGDGGTRKIPDDKIEKQPDEKPIVIENTVTTKKNKTPFKIAAAVGLGGAAVMGGVWIYGYTKMSAFEDTDLTGVMINDGNVTDNEINQDDCSRGYKLSKGQGAFDAACSAYDRAKWLPYVTVGLGVIGGAALVYVLATNDDEEKPAAGGLGKRQKKKKNLIVTPIVTPDGTGATLRFDW